MPPFSKIACISGVFAAAANASCSLSMISRGTPDGAKAADPLRGPEAREAEPSSVGTSGHALSRFRAAIASGAHLAGLDHADRVGDVEPRHMDVAAGDVLEDARAAVLERDVEELQSAGALRQDLSVDVLIGADAGRWRSAPPGCALA